MKLNKHLKSVRKVWKKEMSLTPICYEESGAYLLFENGTSLIHNKTFYRTYHSSIPEIAEGFYFFEILKYLMKYKYWKHERETRGLGVHIPITLSEMRNEIKKHLIKKFHKKMHKEGTDVLQKLNSYSKFVDHCFEFADKDRGSIKLIIQRKVGHNYYSVVTYRYTNIRERREID